MLLFRYLLSKDARGCQLPNTEAERRIVNRKGPTTQISDFLAKTIDLNEMELLMRRAILPVAGWRFNASSKHTELAAKDALFVFLDSPSAGDAARLFKDCCVSA